MTRRSTSNAVRQMLNKGMSVKDICRKLKIAPQTVYNVRYHMNKKRAAETGIKDLASKLKPADEPVNLAAPQDSGKPIGLVQLSVSTANTPMLSTTTTITPQSKPEVKPEVKPTLWQRIKGFFS